MSHIVNIPTAEQIRTESKLRPEQVDITLASVNALELFIAELIADQVNVVESSLVTGALPLRWPFADAEITNAYPSFDDADVDEAKDRQQKNAGLIVKYYVLLALFLTAGQLNEQFLERSREYKSRGDELLKVLKSELSWISGHQASGSTSGATTITTGRGDYSARDDDATWYPV